jgi:hypothetical protein
MTRMANIILHFLDEDTEATVHVACYCLLLLLLLLLLCVLV